MVKNFIFVSIVMYLLVSAIMLCSCSDRDKFIEIKDSCQLITPEADITLYTGMPEFNWSSVDGANSYQLSINGILVTETENISYTLTDTQTLVSGEYYWSLRSKNEFQYYLCGSQKFTIIIPEAAKLIDPKDGACVNNNIPTFSWEDTGGITEYKIEIAVDNEFKNIILSEITDTTSYKSSPLENGLYYWRVISQDVNGKTYTSEVYEMTIDNSFIVATLPNIDGLSPNNANVKDLPILFSWSGDVLSAPYSYYLEISDNDFTDINFSKSDILEPKYTFTSTDYALENKGYNWRVRMDYYTCSGNWSTGIINKIAKACPNVENPILSVNKYCQGDIKAIINFVAGSASQITSAKLNNQVATLVGDTAEIDVSTWAIGTYIWSIEREIDGCLSTFTTNFEITSIENPISNIKIYCAGDIKAVINFVAATGSQITSAKLDNQNATVVGDSAEIDTSTWTDGAYTWEIEREISGCSKVFTTNMEVHNAIIAKGWIGGATDGWQTGSGASSGSDYKSFSAPNGVFLDSTGNIYVSELSNDRISKWDSNGIAQGWIGGGFDGWQTISGATPGSDYKSFKWAFGIFVDNNGTIYGTDYYNNRVSKWDSNGIAQGWIGGGFDGWQQSNGTIAGSNYQFLDYPTGVFLDGDGTIFVADYNNNRVSKWNSNGIAQGWIGGGFDGWQQGNGTTVGTDYRFFNRLIDIHVDNDGNIYATDQNNNRICKWNGSGIAQGWIGGGFDGWQQGNGATVGSGYKYFDHLYDSYY